MPPRKYSLRTTHDHKGKRLDQVLAEWLPQALQKPVSKAQARKLLVAGAVYLNGKRVRIASKPLQANATIDAYVDLAKLGPGSRREPFQLGPERILFEDEWLIAIDKPAGVPTQPTLDEARDNLYGALKKFLAARDGAADPYVGLHHRLDRDTSGVVLFTKKTEANAATAALFSAHKAQKTYLAIAARPRELPGDTWSVSNYLGKTSRTGKQSRFGSVRSGGDPAHTDFRLLERLPRALLIEAMPRTGRTHQIRVHLAEGGMPIVGDALYGGPAGLPGGARMLLHAAKLTFPHPIHNMDISIQSPIPEDFSTCLEQLRGS